MNYTKRMDWRLRSRPMYMEDLDKTTAPLVADGWEENHEKKKGGMDLPPKPTPLGALTPEEKQLQQQRYSAFVKKDVATVRSLGDEIKDKRKEAEESIKTHGIASLGTRRKVFGRSRVMQTAGRKKTRRNTTSGGDLVTSLLTIRDQIKLYHWQTGSFARHKATDDLVGTLDGHIDTFVETYMGKYGRPKVSGTIKLHNFSEKAARDFVAKQTEYLTKTLPRKLKSSDTDLLNIRDEILSDVNKTLYLFTLQ